MEKETIIIMGKKDWLSPADLELEYDIKISTQNKMRMAKTIPYSKIGKFVRYSRIKINKLFEDASVEMETPIEKIRREYGTDK